MKAMLKVVPMLLLVVLMASLSATTLAAPDLQDGEQSIVDVAIADGRFTTLVEALQEANLVEALQGEGPFTVFAPTDEAFAQLAPDTVEALFADTEALADLLQYHVVEGELAADAVSDTDQLETLTGRFLTVAVEEGTVMVNGATVVVPDVQASNGVIHAIDTVLVPPRTPVMEDTMGEEGAMMEETMMAASCAETYVLQANESLSEVASRFLGSPGAYTDIVEATNAAAAESDEYAAIDNPDVVPEGQVLCIPGAGGAMVSDAGAMTDTEMMTGTEMMTDSMASELMADVPEGKGKLVVDNVSAVDLVFDISGTMPETNVIPPGTTANFILDPGPYRFSGHQPGGAFTLDPGTFEIEAGQATGLSCSDSGICVPIQVMPMMEEPMMESEEAMTGTEEAMMGAEEAMAADIVATAIADGRFTRLASALEAAGLVETLQNEGPFTVFAPTDDAFAALPAAEFDSLMEDPTALANLLQYHVVSGEVMSADLSDGQVVETLSGETLTVSIDGDTVTVGGATVIVPDVEASNGVIHAIDTVLMPGEEMMEQ